MKKLFVFLMIVSISFTFSTAQGKDIQKKKVRMSCEVTDQAKLIEVKAGNSFAICLKANPTTGYQWQLTRPLDNTILKETGKEYMAPVTKRVGAGGMERWKFETVGAGKIVIEMKYVRPWEKDQEPANKKSFFVVITE